MATVNKNFRIKHGLVVEGTTGTINGQNILTETGSDTYILNLIGGETLVKSVSGNLSVDNAGDLTINETGLATNLAGSYLYDTTGTINVDVEGLVDNGFVDTTSVQTLTNKTFSDALKFNNGSTNSTIAASGNDLEIDANGDLFLTTGNGDIVLNADGTSYIGSAVSGNEIATRSYADGLASNYDAAGSASSAQTAAQNYADGLASNYDAAGSASSAQTAAQSYTDLALEDYTPTNSLDATVGGYGYLKSADLSTYATQTYADDAADTAEGNANTYTNNLIGDVTVDGTAGNTVTDRIESAVADLVGSAPGTLDTLQELATALENNPDIIADLESVASGKQNTLTAGSNINITADTISVTGLDTDDVSEGTNLYYTDARVDSHLSGGDGINYTSGTLSADVAGGLEITGGQIVIDRDTVDAWYDASGSASTAESNANSYTDTAIGNIASAGSQIDGSTITPGSVTINSVANQYATVFTDAMIVDGASTVMGISASTYRTVKALVKASSGSHTQVSEILVTLDTSNNVAITEYAMVGTNGSLGDVNAIYHASGNIFITFTPVYDNTDIMCYATALI